VHQSYDPLRNVPVHPRRRGPHLHCSASRLLRNAATGLRIHGRDPVSPVQ